LTPTTDRSLVGVVPLRVARWPLSFDPSGRVLAESILRAVVVLGSQPLIPYGRQARHTIPLPATFEEYLAKLTAKKRYNLKRQVRLLKAFANGALELRRVDTPEDVPLLVESVSALRRVPPAPGEDLRLMDLARRGILLGYLLLCGKRRCAVVIGLQHDRTFRLDEMAHDQSIAALSPGSTALYMLIEDLIRQRMGMVDFGYGEPAYPYRSTNVTVERGTILLLRRTFVNRLRRTGHWTFRTAITRLKRLLRRRKSAELLECGLSLLVLEYQFTEDAFAILEIFSITL
jgi:hypothetical protein